MPSEAVAGGRPSFHLRSYGRNDIPRRDWKVHVVVIDFAVDLFQFGCELVDLTDLAELRPSSVDLVEIGMSLDQASGLLADHSHSKVREHGGSARQRRRYRD